MIIKSQCKNEKCVLCNNRIPDGSLVLRHNHTNRIICLVCLIEIAEVKQ